MNNEPVLVLADTSESSEYISGLLQNAGYIVQQDNGRPFDTNVAAVVLDVTHLRDNPFSHLRMVRQNHKIEAPAFLVAPRLTNEMAEELFGEGFRAFMRKPFDEGEFLATFAGFFRAILDEGSAEQTRLALEKTQASLSRRMEELGVLSRIGRSLTAPSDLDTALNRITEAAAFLTHVDTSTIYLLDPETRQQKLRAVHGLPNEVISSLAQNPAGEEIIAVVKSGKPALLYAADYPTQSAHFGPVYGVLATPVVLKRRLVGVLAVYNRRPENFDAVDHTILASLADYIAITLDRLFEIEHLQAQIDAMMATPRLVNSHAQTLYDPVDSIESQTDTLLSGGFDPLTEAQHSAVMRIKQAADRLKEIIGLIRDTLTEVNN